MIIRIISFLFIFIISGCIGEKASEKNNNNIPPVAEDARVNTTIPDAEAELKQLDKSYTYELFEGDGHAFLRNQKGQDGANLNAAKKAWPKTIEFLQKAFK